jgi:hypothetical protein
MNPRRRSFGRARLTDAKVLECRRRKLQGATTAELARECGVAWGTMKKVLQGITWRHVEMPVQVGGQAGEEHRQAVGRVEDATAEYDRLQAERAEKHRKETEEVMAMFAAMRKTRRQNRHS